MTDQGAFGRRALEDLADRPNTKVYDVKFDSEREAWPADKLRASLERLMSTFRAIPEDVDPFRARKQCLEDPQILEFQRAHPRVFWMCTDRAVNGTEEFRKILSAFLALREKVDAKAIVDDNEANALATKAVMQILQEKKASE